AVAGGPLITTTDAPDTAVATSGPGAAGGPAPAAVATAAAVSALPTANPTTQASAGPTSGPAGPGGGPGGAPSTAPPPAPPSSPADSRVAVPDVRGMVLGDASAALRRAGFSNIPYVYDCYRSPDTGNVVRQDPVAGTRIATTSAVRLYLQANDCSDVPNVVGMTLDDAAATLKKVGFTNIPYVYECLNSKQIGAVVTQSVAPGTSYGRSKPVSLKLQANNC
ncbi:PASTA domain-containing protein, partial [Protofrankia coriariae]